MSHGLSELLHKMFCKAVYNFWRNLKTLTWKTQFKLLFNRLLLAYMTNSAQLWEDKCCKGYWALMSYEQPQTELENSQHILSKIKLLYVLQIVHCTTESYLWGKVQTETSWITLDITSKEYNHSEFQLSFYKTPFKCKAHRNAAHICLWQMKNLTYIYVSEVWDE